MPTLILKRRLIDLKKAARKEDVQRNITKKKNTAKRRDVAKVVEENTSYGSCESLGIDSDSAWKYDDFSHNSDSDTYDDTTDDATEDICALHPYAIDCELCADNEDIWIPNAILKARTFSLEAGSPIPISIAAVETFDETNKPPKRGEQDGEITETPKRSKCRKLSRWVHHF